MMISDRETFNAPRDRVFAVLSDIPNAPSRISDIKRVEMLTEGPVRVGTQWRETRLMCGRECTETLEITEFRAPEFYAVGAKSCGTIYRSTFTLREVSPGVTEVEFAFAGLPETLIARVIVTIMGPMMKGMMKKCLASDLAALKTACETNH